mmetsp:Transcript_43924/g.93483  ORF Transcript_43924/g.93483 Transcript_43924/m.93483 type:complete len:136 (+) Transcript_43924:564-971(+)
MRSLHARRPPKLEQGDLRRKRQQKHRNTVHAPTNAGGGSLRRPPNASAIEVPKGGGGSNGGSGGGSKRFCSARRMIVTLLVATFLAFIFMQIREALVLGHRSGRAVSLASGHARMMSQWMQIRMRSWGEHEVNVK